MVMIDIVFLNAYINMAFINFPYFFKKIVEKWWMVYNKNYTEYERIEIKINIIIILFKIKFSNDKILCNLIYNVLGQLLYSYQWKWK